mmetsp:Transcript_19659/g.50093  ORF Transcript_19659/g.50093 Transcript_19659/m.50093 type:complete len:698 (+) Transcript_19659:3-2096(+)
MVLYMFYGLAHVCEDFLVPSLNIFCERRGVPEDVAGATLMAAGCNAPELFASIIGVFFQHSTVGAGTVVGSAPFNILCIVGAAAFAVSGNLVVDGWLMFREIVSLLATFALFLWVMSDGIVLWWEALLLVILYVFYVLFCVYYERLLACFMSRAGAAAQLGGVSSTTSVLSLEAALHDDSESRTRGHLQMPAAAESEANATIPRSPTAEFGAFMEDSYSRHLGATGKQASVVSLPINPKFAEHVRGGTSGSMRAATDLDTTTSMSAPLAMHDSQTVTSDVEPSAFLALVQQCRTRCERYAHEHGELMAAVGVGGTRVPVRMAGVLFKKSRFYSSVRFGKKIWQRRFFVLQMDARGYPLQYHRIADDGTSVCWDKSVAIPLHEVEHVVLFSRVEIHLVAHKTTYKLRCGADVESDIVQQWFDQLILTLDELRALPPPALQSTAAIQHTEVVEEEEHDLWYAAPCGSWWLIVFVLLFPLKAAIHLTIPDPSRARWSEWYMLSIVLAVTWLAILAYAMNAALEKIGCALGVSETVMGLTLGAIGTSFPNLYASVLTARAGQAGMSLCQAFGSNTFNICICLGLVWLVQTLVGQCDLSHHIVASNAFGGACNGCYMPMGIEPMCPYPQGQSPPQQAGSLVGAAYVVFLSVALFIATPLMCRGKIPLAPAGIFFLIYLTYVVYEVLATYEIISPVCLGGSCI